MDTEYVITSLNIEEKMYQFDKEKYPNLYIVYEKFPYIYDLFKKTKIYTFPIVFTETGMNLNIYFGERFYIKSNDDTNLQIFKINKDCRIIHSSEKVVDTTYFEKLTYQSNGCNDISQAKRYALQEANSKHWKYDDIIIFRTGFILDLTTGEIHSEMFKRYLGKTTINFNGCVKIEDKIIKESIILLNLYEDSINNIITVIYDFVNNQELHRMKEGDKFVKVSDNVYQVYNNKFNGHSYVYSPIFTFVLKDSNDIPEDEQCVICFKRTDKKQVLVPCGHRQYCKECIKKVEICSLCRKPVNMVMDLY